MFFKILTFLFILFFPNYFSEKIESSQPILIEQSDPRVKLIKIKYNAEENEIEIVIQVSTHVKNDRFYIQPFNFNCTGEDIMTTDYTYFKHNENLNIKINIVNGYFYIYKRGLTLCLREEDGNIFMRIIPIFATNTEISKEKIEEGIEKRPIEVNGIDLLINQDNNLYKLSKLNFNYYLNKNNNKFEEESTSSKGKEIIQENKEFFELNIWIEFTKPGKYLIRLTQDMYEYPSFVLQFFIKVEKREILPNENSVTKHIFKQFKNIKKGNDKIINKLMSASIKGNKNNDVKNMFNSKQITEEEIILFKKIIKGLQIYVGETDFKDESEIKLFIKPSSYDEFSKNLINIANIIPFLNDNFFYEIKNNDKDDKKGEGNKKGKKKEGFNYSKAMGAFGIGN